MLAGPKRSQKYSIDPRGTVWANDESKIGNKLMEKMGWSKGQGLGANMTGDPHHVIIRKKLDNKGVGCTNKHADNWLAHQDDFNSLLDNLKADHTDGGTSDPGTNQNNSTDETAEVASNAKHSSLDELAKKRKRRLHYHKFTKGKDLSLIKSGDLDKIMGKRAKVKSPEVTPIASNANSCDESGGLTKLHGVETTTSTNSIQEYFSKKMAQLKENRASSNSLYSENNVINEQERINDIPEADSDSNESDGIIMMHSPVLENEEDKKCKSKKKRKNIIEEEEPTKKKKKSKKRKHDAELDCEEVKKKKKSKSSKKEAPCEDVDIEVKTKKKKKNKKNKKE